LGKVYDAIDEKLREFIGEQRLFFVATAPLSGSDLVNLSPKGLDSFAVLDDHTVAYLDLVGSGVETIAHLRENGRITLMFCAFGGRPLIVRFHGRGEVVEPGDADFDELAGRFPAHASTRAVIRVQVERISDSCGYGVPLYEYKEERSQLPAWAERKGPEGVRRYQLDNNRESLDGLPGLRAETLLEE